MHQTGKAVGDHDPNGFPKSEKGAVGKTARPGDGEGQAPSPQVLAWLDKHAAHILPMSRGFGYGWNTEPLSTWRFPTPVLKLSEVAAKGAIFTTTCCYDKKPMLAPEERKDLVEHAVKRLGHFCLDFDCKADPGLALADVRRLVFDILPPQGVKSEHVQAYFSGSKGFHVIVYMESLGLEQGSRFLPAIYKELVVATAGNLPTLDHSLYCWGYGKQFRLPQIRRDNGLHKVPLTVDEIREGGLSIEDMREIGSSPRLLDLPEIVPSAPDAPIRGIVLRIVSQVRQDTAKPRPEPRALTGADREALAEESTPCVECLLKSEDYGEAKTNFDELVYSVAAPHAARIGLGQSEAVDLFGGWAANFTASETYTTAEARLAVLEKKLAAKPVEWSCQVARAKVPYFERSACANCRIGKEQAAKEVADAFGHDGFAEAAEVDRPEVEPKRSKRAFQFISMEELFTAPRPVRWLIADYIEADSLVSLFGASGSMKSFVAIDAGLCIASGRPWHGHKVVDPGPVLYIAGEGRHGLTKRVKAWTVAHGVGTVPFFVSEVGAQFLEDASLKDVQAAVAEFAATHGAPKLIIVDTLSRNFGPGDENSSMDMARYVAALDKLKAPYGCAVVTVHHTGLDNQDRARGSSVFRAAMDFEYQLAKKESSRVLKCTKAKDHDEPQNKTFVPHQVDTGWTDPETGAAITSCVLDSVDVVHCVPGPADLKGAKRIAYDALVAVCGRVGGVASEDAWRQEAYTRGVSPSDKVEAKRKAFRRAVEDLRDAGFVEAAGEDTWQIREEF